MSKLETSKEHQLNFKGQLSDKECEEYYNAIMKSADKWIVDSPLGKQVAKWFLKRKNTVANTKGLQISVFQEFTSPIDGTVIASTQQLREHESKHGVKQVGNDFKK